MKMCSHCGQEKPPSAFGKNVSEKDHLTCMCKECRTLYQRFRRAMYPETEQRECEKKKRWYAVPENRAKAIERSKANYLRNRKRYRDTAMQKKYGISVDQYDAILESQGGGCAICGRTTPGRSGHDQFHIDHDHATGGVRGLLCSHCNTAIGLLRESTLVITNAADYLLKANIKINEPEYYL